MGRFIQALLWDGVARNEVCSLSESITNKNTRHLKTAEIIASVKWCNRVDSNEPTEQTRHCQQ